MPTWEKERDRNAVRYRTPSSSRTSFLIHRDTPGMTSERFRKCGGFNQLWGTDSDVDRRVTK
jgi:hypothetical protein